MVRNCNKSGVKTATNSACCEHLHTPPDIARQRQAHWPLCTTSRCCCHCCWNSLKPDRHQKLETQTTKQHTPTDKRPGPCTTCIRPPHCTSCAQTTVRAPHTKETPGQPVHTCLCTPQEPSAVAADACWVSSARTHARLPPQRRKKQHHPLPCMTAAYTRGAPHTSRAQGASQAAAAVTTQGSQCC